MLSILGAGLVVLGLLKKNRTIEIKPETRLEQHFLVAPLAYIAIPNVERKVFIGYRTVTAYNPSDPKQTRTNCQKNATCCVTASGENACASSYKIVANNEMVFGSRVEIADKIYVVNDRMNRRYPNRYDIALLEGAKEWGVKVLPVYIIEETHDETRDTLTIHH